MPDLEPIFRWIEQHDKTVDLLKWIALLILAWAVGLFRFLRNLTRKPRVRVSELTSRCFIEAMDEYEGHKNAVRAALLLEVDVTNRSSAPVVVRTMEARICRIRPLFRWGPWISAISLPNRVQHKMGSGTKLLRNWFSHFSDGIDHLTINGKVESRNAESGFALFVSFTHGSWNPRVEANQVRVRVRVHLTTGEKLQTTATIPLTKEAEFFEGMVPGVLNQIRHPSAWNVPLRCVVQPNRALKTDPSQAVFVRLLRAA